MTRSEILEKARQCVCEDRDRQYGHPEDNFGKIAELWGAYRGEYFPVKDVAMMMALVKIARIYAGESIDSYVDLAGYAACGGELATEERQTSEEQEEPQEQMKTQEGAFPKGLIMELSEGTGDIFVSLGSNAPRERFYFHSDGKWIGLDNRSGDAWVEEFDSEEECLSWLRDEREVGEDDEDDEEEAE